MKKNFLIAAILTGTLSAAFGIYAATTPVNNDATASLLNRQFKDSNGQTQTLANYQGKMLLVNFWATWCAPCVKEMPELSALQKEMQSKGVQIVGIGIDSPSNIKEFLQKYEVSYPVMVAGMEGTDLSRQLGNKSGALPFTLLIDRQGKVAKTYLGRLKMEELHTDITKLSSEKSK
jgi:thiol-disulfide isomerase/thioredoxin